MNLKKGFTLLELIIVIAIISILAMMGYTSYTVSLKKANDARRKSDLKQIMTALQLYYNENGRYPLVVCGPNDFCSVNSTNTSTDWWIPGLTSEFIKKMPVDPKNNGPYPWVSGQYSYAYGNVTPDGQSFDLVTQLEWTNDPDRCAVQHYKMYGNDNGGQDWCGSYSPNLYQQTPP